MFTASGPWINKAKLIWRTWKKKPTKLRAAFTVSTLCVCVCVCVCVWGMYMYVHVVLYMYVCVCVCVCVCVFDPFPLFQERAKKNRKDVSSFVIITVCVVL